MYSSGDKNQYVVIDTMAYWRRETNRTLGRICRALNNYKVPRDEVYKTVEERGKCKLNEELKKLKKRAAEQGIAQGKIKTLNYLDVIENNSRLRDIYIDAVKNMAAKHRVVNNYEA